MGDLLHISPHELKFRFELRKTIPVTLTMKNPGEDPVAFKIKTTKPKKYCVKPTSGFVEPGETKSVQLIMQAQDQYPASFSEIKDKFLVQSIKLTSKDEYNPSFFNADSDKEIKQSKFKVVLVGPPKPPSPVPEGSEEDGPHMRTVNDTLRSNERAQTQTDVYGSTINNSTYNSELARVSRECDRLKEQLAKAAHSYNDTMQNSAGNVTRKVDGYSVSLPLLIISVLVAFLAGCLSPKLY